MCNTAAAQWTRDANLVPMILRQLISSSTQSLGQVVRRTLVFFLVRPVPNRFAMHTHTHTQSASEITTDRRQTMATFQEESADGD